jgi:hypothetical protein
MSRTSRAIVAVFAAILSVPAIVASAAGPLLVLSMAQLGGFHGNSIDAFFAIVRDAAHSLTSLGVLAAAICALLYWFCFGYLVLSFARDRAASSVVKFYCLVVLILAVGERLRLELVSSDTFFWFGALSVPHALALPWFLARSPNKSARASDHIQTALTN